MGLPFVFRGIWFQCYAYVNKSARLINALLIFD